MVRNETTIQTVSNPGTGGKQLDPINLANECPSKTSPSKVVSVTSVMKII